VATDIEATVPQALDAAVAEKPSSVEHVARANMVKAVAVFLGLVSLAVRNQDPDWPAYLSMAAGIGVLAGVFFGLLAGFMRSIPLVRQLTRADGTALAFQTDVAWRSSRLASRDRYPSRSMIVALAMPPRSHIVWSP